MINISQLGFSYSDDRQVFKNLDLSLQSGNIYGLLGKNGAGKTTLIKIIMGLRRPQQGTTNAFGYDPSLRSAEYLQQSFFLPEDPYMPEISIKEYVDRFAPFYPQFDIQTFLKVLHEFQLDRTIHLKNLSFGQKKKAVIAFGIATHTPLLIMDEPTNGLDIPSKKQFRKIIAQLANDDRLFLISTHQIRDLHSLIDHVILLDDGALSLNHSLGLIEDRLSFHISRVEPKNAEVIYYERVLGGYLCISKSGHEEDLEVDLEVLFNAVTTEKDQILNLLNI